jgi:hypothetical protein
VGLRQLQRREREAGDERYVADTGGPDGSRHGIRGHAGSRRSELRQAHEGNSAVARPNSMHAVLHEAGVRPIFGRRLQTLCAMHETMRWISHDHEAPHQRSINAPTRGKDTTKRGMPAQSVSPPFHLFFVTDRELPATFCPTARKNFPSIFRRHALAKAVRVLPLPLVRLKRPLHTFQSPTLRILPRAGPSGEKKRVALAGQSSPHGTYKTFRRKKIQKPLPTYNHSNLKKGNFPLAFSFSTPYYSARKHWVGAVDKMCIISTTIPDTISYIQNYQTPLQVYLVGNSAKLP